jgi:hypothetical protein
MDLRDSFLVVASELARAAQGLGHRLNDTKRSIPVPGSAPERAPRPPEPETSRLLNAVRAIDPVFRQVSDPALGPVKEVMKRLRHLVMQCLPLRKCDYNQPLWVSGCAFFNTGSALEQAIKAVPRIEPVYALWAEPEPIYPAAELQTPAVSPTPPTPVGTATTTDLWSNSVVTEAPEDFLEFSTKQRKLLKALHQRGSVAFAALKKAVYGTTQAEDSALEQLKSRTNKKLAERSYPFQISREGKTFRLTEL